MTDANLRTSWCSWCYRKTEQRQYATAFIIRNVYWCLGCKNLVTTCRAPGCGNGSRDRMDPTTFNFAGQGKLQRIAASWSDWYCAEHDGSIAAFDRLDMRLKEIENFRSMFEDRKTNYARVTRTVAGAAVVSALVAVTVATGGAAAVATALGAAGALGTAGTGTAHRRA